MRKCLVVGSGGREASIIENLKRDCIVYGFMSYRNPGIVKAIKLAGGKFIIGDVYNGKEVLKFAKENEIEICVVNNDNILAAGVVDFLRKGNISTFGPTKKGAKIEWSKSYARLLTVGIDSDLSIRFSIVNNKKELKLALEKMKGVEIVVKPDGLTGGKGVKVTGEHLKNMQEVFEYANSIIENGNKVILEEKVNGFEFTVMGFTDGENLIMAPVTYDYPYRFNGDRGPGTGGMGCFTLENGLLPCLSDEDISKCKIFMQKVIKKINKEKIEFNGVLNGGFFKTDSGDIKLMEFNARLGDPECLNIMAMLDVPFLEIVEMCAEKKVDTSKSYFKKKYASIVVYIVSKDYALTDRIHEESVITIDESSIEKNKCQLIFNSCDVKKDKYIAVGNSRILAIVACEKSIELARNKVYESIKKYIRGNIDYRTDIACNDIINKMNKS